MPTLTARSRIDAPANVVFDWHKRPGALQRLTPPWARVTVKEAGGIQEGDRAVVRIGIGPGNMEWILEHRGYVEGRQFVDVQVKGPFHRWEHTHRFEPDGPDACTLIDRVEFEYPLGKPVEELVQYRVEDQLERQFAYRHRIVKHDLERHRTYSRRPLRVAVTGSHGLIGSALTYFLETGGHEVIRLVRSTPSPGEAYWNPREGIIETEKLEGLDAVVHLAGENVFALRWTEEKKKRILQSRIDGSSLLAETLARLKNPPAVLISASGIGYYGDRGSEVLTEDSPLGETGFITAVAHEWEAAARPAADAGIRLVNARMGVVLSPAGGALQVMLPIFKVGLGGQVGDRDQYLSWIALDDAIYGLYHTIWTDNLQGPVNFTAPNPVTMDVFTRMVARVLRRPSLFTIPSPLLRFISGEAAEDMILTSTRAQPTRLLETGYTFAYPDLEGALRHQLGYTRKAA